ncbi:ABC transporter permease [Corynebacterium hansenii]|uniref:ABC transporter permease n=1 Tax=Corynebacterium hansenii TaxID=394964 RepID=A0ABV7ZKC5_9CORY|nr:FtsX-like permease family protein [Corynebacterium hansenii]WJY99535.1 Macrolide export ATP-binding/permease protein MacB [Corynebacterium hansenii]
MNKTTNNKLAYSLTPYIGALLEAWHELRINRNRIMLSLVSVAAAVWAMSTVIALGNILTSSSEASSAQYSGIAGTVTLSATPGSGGGEGGGAAAGGPAGAPIPGMPPMASSQGSAGETLDVVKPDGSIDDAFSDAALKTVGQVGANTWTRMRTQTLDVQIPSQPKCDPATDPSCVPQQTPEMHGVDPGWFDIHRKTIIAGRALQPEDGQRLMNPVVVNEALWEKLGNPDVASHPTFTARETGRAQFTVVGVMKGIGSWDSPLAVTHYDTLMHARHTSVGSPKLLVAAPPEEAKEAQRTLSDMLRGHLGGGWQVTGSTADRNVEQTEQMNSMITKVLGIIGGIVIALGALGLLTVSIVTIGHRVREIGIRRAMGASAARIFISVFLESIVATTVAGVVGVILSIITVKQLPIADMLEMPMDLGSVPYPLTAAFMGVAIASLVGAMAGVIPATIAVRVKPIDAIRF